MKVMHGAIVAVAVLAWGAMAADDSLLKPANVVDNWRLEQHEGGKAAASVDGDALLVDVTAVEGDAWHVQIFQIKLDLKAGKEYTLTFKAKASEARDIQANAGIDEEDWHAIGLDEAVSLTTEWKDCKCVFTVADPKADNNRLGFQLGQSKGKVWIKDVVLKVK
jgi:hypothetical protein